MDWKQINGKRWTINTVRPKRNKNICLQIFVYNICGSFSHNRQKLETIEMPINRWMVKQNVAYSYHIILLSNKTIQQKDINYWYKQHGWISKSKWKKSDTKEEYTVWFHLLAYKMQTNLQTNRTVVCTRNRGRDGVDIKDKRNLLGVIEISWLWWWFVGIFNCQNSLNCTLQMYAIVVCKLFLNNIGEENC